MSYCYSGCVCPSFVNFLHMNEHTFNIIKEILGSMACIISAFLFIPSIVHMFIKGNTENFSITFLIIFFMGCVFWLMYAIMIFSIQTILLEIFLIINLCIISVYKRVLYYKKKRLPTPVQEEA